MANMIGPLPAAGWAVALAAGGLIYFAGKDLNKSSNYVVQGYPVAPYRFGFPFFNRRRNRNPPMPTPGPIHAPLPGDGQGNNQAGNVGGIGGEGGGPISAGIGAGVGSPVLHHSPGDVPGTDVAAPPYTEFPVISPIVNQQYPGVNYLPAGESDNLFTIAMRLYNNPLRAYDIFNANRLGSIRTDGTPGLLPSPNNVLPGTVLIIP